MPRCETTRGVATITLDQPDTRNALSVSLLDGLGDQLSDAIADEQVRVVVVTNEGNTFCAGADLTAVGATPARWELTRLLELILDSPKPIVGRIAGHCMGGGVGLAAAFDLSVAAEDARFGFTEVRIGVAPAMISVVCLPKLRRADALELFLSGERISATRAAEVGLITKAAADIDAVVAGWVRSLLAGGPRALAAAKRLVFSVPELERSAAFATTATLSAELFASEEGAEGIAAFRERRPAAWIPD